MRTRKHQEVSALEAINVPLTVLTTPKFFYVQSWATVQSSSSQVQQEMSTEFHTEQIVTIAGGHVVHDTYTAFIAPLLPLLRERLGIGYASVSYTHLTLPTTPYV